MSRATDEINKVTGTIIGLSWKLIIIAVVILLLFEGATRGYRFGYEIFSPEPVESAPGRDITITVSPDESDLQVLNGMKQAGLINSSYAALAAVIFFDYDIYPGTYTLNTSMTSREMLEELNVRPEDYVEETVSETPEETYAEEVIAPSATSAEEYEEAHADDAPSEMVWEAVEAEAEPEGEVVMVEEAGNEAEGDEIEIHID